MDRTKLQTEKEIAVNSTTRSLLMIRLYLLDIFRVKLHLPYSFDLSIAESSPKSRWSRNTDYFLGLVLLQFSNLPVDIALAPEQNALYFPGLADAVYSMDDLVYLLKTGPIYR